MKGSDQMTREEIKGLYEVMFNAYPDIVNVHMLEKMLSISRHTAYQLIQSGEVPAIKLGNTYRIPKINVISYALSLNAAKAS